MGEVNHLAVATLEVSAVHHLVATTCLVELFTMQAIVTAGEAHEVEGATTAH